MATASERLYDLDVRHQIGLQRYSTATVRKVLALLARTEADIVRQIEVLSWEDVQRAAARRARLEKMLEALKAISAEGAKVISRALRKELEALAAYEAEYQADLITEVTAAVTVQPTAEELNAAVNARPFQGKYLKDWVKDLDDASFKRLRDTIRIGYVEGESVANIVKRVRGTAALEYRDGVMEISRRGATALVRTAITHVASAAKEEFYRANADAFEGVRWSSVIDRKTSAICRARDGKVYPIGKGPRPPAHVNCRSTVIAVLLGDPDIPADDTYQGWLKRQPASVQDDILGRTKGKLFRDGGLQLDRFVDRSGSELTLLALRKKEASAFTKARL